MAVKVNTDQVLAAGKEAKEMLGKTPENIIAVRPMRDGVIANFKLTESMLRHFIRIVHNDRRTLVRPRMIIGVPSGITQVEKRAVVDLQSKQAHAKYLLLWNQWLRRLALVFRCKIRCGK